MVRGTPLLPLTIQTDDMEVLCLLDSFATDSDAAAVPAPEQGAADAATAAVAAWAAAPSLALAPAAIASARNAARRFPTLPANAALIWSARIAAPA